MFNVSKDVMQVHDCEWQRLEEVSIMPHPVECCHMVSCCTIERTRVSERLAKAGFSILVFLHWLMRAIAIGCILYCILILHETIRTATCLRAVQLPPSLGCNQDVKLCGRRYNAVAFATAHNAFCNTQQGFLVAQHRGCIKGALVAGVRAFMLDVHLTASGRSVMLCHGSCAIGWLSLSGTLAMFHEFMVLNPREVVTIMFEFGYDMRKTPSSKEHDTLRRLLNTTMHESQLVQFSHIQTSLAMPGDWPTLETMISSGKRLVLFTESRAAEREVWENNMYHFTLQTGFTLVDIDDLEKQCVLTRQPSPRTLIVFNHFTILGAIGVNGASTGVLSTVFKLRFFADVNHSPFFTKQIISCARQLQSFPSFVTVDFWESSDVVQVVDQVLFPRWRVGFCAGNTGCHYTRNSMNTVLWPDIAPIATRRLATCWLKALIYQLTRIQEVVK